MEKICGYIDREIYHTRSFREEKAEDEGEFLTDEVYVVEVHPGRHFSSVEPKAYKKSRPWPRVRLQIRLGTDSLYRVAIRKVEKVVEGDMDRDELLLAAGQLLNDQMKRLYKYFEVPCGL